jgi:DNA polymerase-3 subunit delta
MKIDTKDATNFLKSPAKASKAVLLFGPDSGLVRERAQSIIHGLLGNPYDPMNLTELMEEHIKTDPARLHDEMSSFSLLGGSGARVVYVRDASDKISDVIANLFDGLHPTAYLILASDDLSTGSSLRKYCDTSRDVASVACYRDDGRALETVIREYLEKADIRASRDVLQFLTSHTGGDRQVTLKELEKIVIFQGSDSYLTLDNVVKLVGQNDFFSQDDLSNAIALADLKMIESYLKRMLLENVQPVVIIRGVQRHFQRLYQVKSAMQESGSLEQAMSSLRPPIYYKFAPLFRQHIARWDLQQISRALGALLQAERDIKTTGSNAPLMLSRALYRVARMASGASKEAA